MLLPLSDLDYDQQHELHRKLNEFYKDPTVQRAFNKEQTPVQWMTSEPFSTAVPSHQTMTFASVDDKGEIHGVYQAYITQSEDYIIQCLDTAVINLGSKMRFGRDQREFYDFLVGFCHRIEVSGLIDTGTYNPIDHVGPEARHFQRYGARRIGQRHYYVKNIQGDYMHQILWEIITPKGKIRYNIT